jgi:hypothetical protein
MNYSQCGKEIPKGSRLCLQCGSSVTSQEPTKKRQNMTLVAVLLLVIIGCAVYLITNGYVGEPMGELGRVVGIAEQDFTIRVTGDTDLKFHGSYMVISSGGSSNSQSVEGVTPTAYNATGKIVSASFQKKGKGGNLRIEILRGGEVVKQSSTSAAYGLATVATN